MQNFANIASRRAWNLFKTDQFDEANKLSRELLLEPRLGKYRRTGLHLILAHSPNGYVAHAEAAVQLYKDLWTDPNNPPTIAQQAVKDKMIKSAERVLAKAKEDAVQYNDPSTYKDTLQDMEDFWEAVDEGPDTLGGGMEGLSTGGTLKSVKKSTGGTPKDRRKQGRRKSREGNGLGARQYGI